MREERYRTVIQDVTPVINTGVFNLREATSKVERRCCNNLRNEQSAFLRVLS